MLTPSWEWSSRSTSEDHVAKRHSENRGRCVESLPNDTLIALHGFGSGCCPESAVMSAIRDWDFHRVSKSLQSHMQTCLWTVWEGQLSTETMTEDMVAQTLRVWVRDGKQPKKKCCPSKKTSSLSSDIHAPEGVTAVTPARSERATWAEIGSFIQQAQSG